MLMQCLCNAYAMLMQCLCNLVLNFFQSDRQRPIKIVAQQPWSAVFWPRLTMALPLMPITAASPACKVSVTTERTPRFAMRFAKPEEFVGLQANR